MASKQQEQTKRYTAIVEAIYVLKFLQIAAVTGDLLSVGAFDIDQFDWTLQTKFLISCQNTRQFFAGLIYFS